jgi:hypothetical protein
MDIEQPELGNVGVDQCTVVLSWSWDRGWRARVATRPSGSSAFREVAYDGRDAAEMHAALSDHLADVLGLI